MNTELLDSPGLMDVPHLDEAPEDDLAQRLEARLFDLASPPVKPESRYCINGVEVCTPGNLTVVSAAEKSGKSAFIGAMQAAVLATDPTSVDCLGVTSANRECAALLHFDTEQSPYDHHELATRVLRRAGVKESPPWHRSYCLTGFRPDEVRRGIVMVLQEAQELFGGIHSVLVDGVADLIWDVNDPDQSNELVMELHGLAIQFQCPILGVIHLNPGQKEKTRGHLGSQLDRKAETNLRLEKDQDNTIVWSEKSRRRPILKNCGPCFRWSNEEQMHVSVRNLQQARIEGKRERLKELVQAVFAYAHTSQLPWKEFIKGVHQTDGGSESGARKKFDAMRKLGVIRQVSNGHYELV